MKKLVTVLIMLSTISVFGQNHFVGLKSGISWTNVASADYVVDNTYRNGFTGGLTYEYLFTNKFHFGCDLIYAQKGFIEKVAFTDVIGNPIGDKESVKFNYDYLSLPIKGGITIGNKFAGFLNLGIVPSLLMNAKTKTPSIDNIEGETYDISDRVTKLDFAGMVEIGASYKLQESFILYTSFAYQQSFTSIGNEEYNIDSNAKHYGMALSVGFKYALKI